MRIIPSYMIVSSFAILLHIHGGVGVKTESAPAPVEALSRNQGLDLHREPSLIVEAVLLHTHHPPHIHRSVK